MKSKIKIKPTSKSLELAAEQWVAIAIETILYQKKSKRKNEKQN